MRTGRPTIHVGLIEVMSAVALAMAYAACAWVSVAWETAQGLAVVWPAGGVAVAWVMLSRPAARPALVAGVFAGGTAANLLLGRGVIAPAFGAVDALEVLVATALLTRLAGARVDLRSVRSVVGLIVTAVATPALTAPLGAGLAAAGLGAGFPGAVQVWWLSNSLGLLVVVAAAAALASAVGPHRQTAGRGTVLLGLAVAGASAALFLIPADAAPPLLGHSYPAIALLAATAGLMAPHVAALTLALVSSAATAGTAAGRGPIAAAHAGIGDGVLEVQGFVGACAVLTLLVAAAASERRRVHEELRTARDRSRALVESLNDGLCVMDADGVLVEVNPRLCEMTGFRRDDLVGRRAPLPFEDPSEGDLCAAARRMVEGGGAGQFPLGVVHRDGRRLSAVVSVSPLRDEAGRVIGAVCLLRDVTEQAAAERAREASEARFRQFVEFAPDGVVVADGDGRIVIVNAQVERMFGYGRDDLIGQPVEVLLPARLREAHAAHRSGYAADAQTRSMGAGLDLLGRRADGTEFPVDVSLAPLRTGDGALVAAAVRDVTERRRAERALRLSEERYRSLVGALADGVILIGASGSITDCNPAAERILGMSRDDILAGRFLGHGWRLVREDGAPLPVGEALTRRTLATGDPVHAQVVGMERPDGTRVWLSVSTEPVRLGEEAAVVASFADITARVEGEREQAALRRLATLVAAEPDPRRVFDAIAGEAAAAFGAEAAGVMRFVDGASAGVLVGAWTADASPGARYGGRQPLDAATAVGQVAASGAAARLGDGVSGAIHPSMVVPDVPVSGSVAAPIVVDGAVWGALTIVTTAHRLLPADAEERLGRLSDLAALAIVSADARAQLAALASTDPLTGLANRRAFQERLADEIDRAARHGRVLSLVVIDIDHFKLVNDTCGHPAGDRVLVEVARRIGALARGGEVVARVGGEEFAWILPGADGAMAVGAAERVRRAVAGEPFPDVGTLTVSAGVCGMDDAATAADMFRLADAALYWAKANGRNRVLRYSDEALEALSAGRGEAELERATALSSLQELARMVDARSAAGERHSERVAALARRMALAAGWSARDAGRLHEAALVHDIGKAAIPDEAWADGAEREAPGQRLLRRHPAAGAAMVQGVLGDDQAAWVRGHHERHDGGGYPDGRAGADVPEGARLLAVADAWDALTDGAEARAPATAEALAACREGAGTRFDPDAVAALERALADTDEEPGRAGVPAGAAGGGRVRR